MTHAHADHTGGLDDLRRFNELAQAHLPMYADPVCAGMLRERYAYLTRRYVNSQGASPDQSAELAPPPGDVEPGLEDDAADTGDAPAEVLPADSAPSGTPDASAAPAAAADASAAGANDTTQPGAQDAAAAAAPQADTSATVQ